MDNNSLNDNTRQRMVGSVDGFSRPRQRPSVKTAPPLDKPLSQNTATYNTVAPMAKPKPVFKSAAASNGGSLIGTTLSGYQTKPLSQPASSNTPKTKKVKKHKKLKRTLLALAVIVLALVGYVGVRGLNTIDKVFHGNIFSDIGAAFSSDPLKGESSGRVNILLAGDSSDQIGHGGADLTDSILVLSIDTQNHTAFLLSIPRDLWVNIPGVGMSKINAANNGTGTNHTGYPQNGMGQLQYIVTTDLGIPIDYYALSDYGAFRDAVNAVGGVTVDIQSPDPRGLYDPNVDLKIPNGEVALNGQTALNLARARGDGYGSYGFPNSDFDRTEHQRQIFTAVAQKAATLGFLSNPAKISDLFNAVGNNVETNMSLQNILRLTQISKGLNLNNIKSYAYCSTLSIGQNGCTNPILTDYTDPASGQEALIPESGIGDYGQLQQFYQQLTSSNPVVKEAATAVILNGSGVNGLAKTQQNIDEAKGIDVLSVANASNNYPTTMIIDNSKGTKPNTLKLLQQLYVGSTVTESSTATGEAAEANPYSSADFVVVLGQNWDSSAANSNQNNL